MRGITITFCFAILAVAGAFLFFISDLVPYSGSDAYFRQPRFFPIVTLTALLGLGLALVAKYALGAALPVDEELAGSRPQFQVLVPLALTFVGYILLVPLIGYLAATLVFSCAALVAGHHLTRTTAFSVIVLGVVLYLVFVAYLDVWFPEPLIMRIGALN